MADLNFHQLRVFHTAAAQLSFSRAAEQLLISQPAVSAHIRDLERALGGALFERKAGRLRLTELGTVVYAQAERVFAAAAGLQAAVEAVHGLRGGRLVIGASTTSGEYVLPRVLGRFSERYPNVELHLDIANTARVLERVRRHELDLALVGEQVSDPGLASQPVLQDEIAVVASPRHHLARRGRLTPAALQGVAVVWREPGSATRKAAEATLAALGIEVRPRMELGSNEAVKQAVAANLGLGFISCLAIAAETAAGYLRVLDVRGWHCVRPLSLVRPSGRQLTGAERALLALLAEETRSAGLSNEGWATIKQAPPTT